MDKYPFSDIPEQLADTLSIYAQNREIFDSFHAIAEQQSRIFSLAHTAASAATKLVFDEQPAFGEAYLLGVQTYEVFSGAISLQADNDSTFEVARHASLSLLDPDTLADFRERGQQQAALLKAEIPILHEAILEVSSRHLNHNRHALLYAEIGAGMVRNIHCEVTRNLNN